MRDRCPSQRDLFHILLGPLDSLADGLRYFPCLAHTDADATLVVSDDHDRPEGESPAALDNLGRPGNMDDSFV
jgi:hypothetical protein